MLRVPDFSLHPTHAVEHNKFLEETKNKKSEENKGNNENKGDSKARNVESTRVDSTGRASASPMGQRGKEKLRPISSVKTFVIGEPSVKVEIRPVDNKGVKGNRGSVAFPDISFEEIDEDDYTLNK